MMLYISPGPLRTFAAVLVVTMGLHTVGEGLGVSDAVTVIMGVTVSVNVGGGAVSITVAVGASVVTAPLGRLQLTIAVQMARIEKKTLLLSMLSPLTHYLMVVELIQ
jgi:hypothetical protein